MKLSLTQRKPRFYWGLASIPLLSIAIYLLPNSIQFNLAYSRMAVENGEVWRFITAHFVHQDLKHLLLNLVSWIAIRTWGHFILQQSTPWVAPVLGCCLVVGLCLFYFDPRIPAYVGLSGVLYGYLFVELTISAFAFNKLAQVGLFLISGKLTAENFYGPNNGFSILSPAQIPATQAHIWGACAGFCLGLLITILRHTPPNHARTSSFGPSSDS